MNSDRIWSVETNENLNLSWQVIDKSLYVAEFQDDEEILAKQ